MNAAKGVSLKLPVALRPRERRLALVAAVLIGCWAIVSWLVQPLWNGMRSLQLRVDVQSEKLDALGQLLSQAPAVEGKYQEIAPYLASGNDERAQGALLESLEALARTANLQLNLKPRAVKRQGTVSQFEVELDVEGPQDRLLPFLDAVLGIPRLVAVERLRIASVPTNAESLRANLVLQQLSLQE